MRATRYGCGWTGGCDLETAQPYENNWEDAPGGYGYLCPVHAAARNERERQEDEAAHNAERAAALAICGLDFFSGSEVWLAIVDRDKAVAWFEKTLAEFDADAKDAKLAREELEFRKELLARDAK